MKSAAKLSVYGAALARSDPRSIPSNGIWNVPLTLPFAAPPVEHIDDGHGH